VHAAADLGKAPSACLAQAMGRDIRATGFVTLLAKPIAKAG
jgi:hypothetical protein